MPHYFINIVHTGLPKSTFRSRGKKKSVPKIMFMRMTEILSNTTVFCRLKKGERMSWN